MITRSTRLTRFGAPALVGALVAVLLALTTGLSSLNLSVGAGATPGAEKISTGSSATGPISVDKGTLSTSSVDLGAAAAAPAGAPRVDVVRSGNIAIEVRDADASLTSITEFIVSSGGHLSGSSRYGQGDQLNMTATFRIPEINFDAVMEGLRKDGKVLSEDVNSYEVTMQLIDLEARLKNLRASEAEFIALLKRAANVSDVVAVQAELSQVQGDIESFDAQRIALADQVAMSSINVTLSLPVSAVNSATADFNIVDEISNALANLITVGRTVLVVAINLLMIGIPIAVIGGLFGSLIGRALSAVAAWFRKSFSGSRKGTRRAARR